MTRGEELVAQRARDKEAGLGHCLGCNHELVGHDTETGFPRRWCEHCLNVQRTANARAAALSGEGAAKRAERIKREAMDNLDRLMRGEAIVPVQP